MHKTISSSGALTSLAVQQIVSLQPSLNALRQSEVRPPCASRMRAMSHRIPVVVAEADQQTTNIWRERPRPKRIRGDHRMSPEQITVGRCYRILIDARMLVAKVLEIRNGPNGFVRWTLAGTDPRHARTDPLAKFASCAEAEVRC